MNRLFFQRSDVFPPRLLPGSQGSRKEKGKKEKEKEKKKPILKTRLVRSRLTVIATSSRFKTPHASPAISCEKSHKC